MTEEERRRCCILGGCGCQPGGAEQRAALRSWLVERFDPKSASEGPDDNWQQTYIDRALDDLFQDTQGKVLASSKSGEVVLGYDRVEVDLDLTGEEF